MRATLSIWSQYYHEMKIEDAVLEFKKNGIYASELSDEHGAELLSRSDDHIATGKQLAAFLDEQDFEISQGHLWLNAKICTNEGAIDTLYKWIDMYEAIGIKNMVLHCDCMAGSTLTRDERIQRNLECL